METQVLFQLLFHSFIFSLSLSLPLSLSLSLFSLSLSLSDRPTTYRKRIYWEVTLPIFIKFCLDQIGRDEVEERLLDTQGLVETMEIKNKQTFQVKSTGF